MRLNIIITTILLYVFACCTAYAQASDISSRGIPVTRPYDGQGPGQSTIGPGGDYATIFEASQDIQAYPLTGGDWTFLITGDLTETNNSYIAQSNTNGHNITFKPAPNTVAEISFTTATENQLYQAGHIIIGVQPTAPQSGRVDIVPTNNIVFDGYDTVTSQALVFTNRDCGFPSAIFSITGDCDNITIRNCRLESFGVDFATHQFPANGVDMIGEPYYLGAPTSTWRVPDNILIENCEITCSSPTHAQMAISYNDMISYTTPDMQPVGQNIKILNNAITTSDVGIGVMRAADLDISGNRIIITPAKRYQGFPKAGDMVGIRCWEASTADVSDIRINANVIQFPDKLTSYALTGIRIESRVTASSFEVTNNMISGLIAPHPGFDIFSYGVVSSIGALTSATIAHNSVSFFDHANSAATTATKCAAFVFANPFQGTAIVKNNIVRTSIPDSAAIARLRSGGTIVSDYNNFYCENGSHVGFLYPEVYSTMAQWQSSTLNDSHSISLDPFVASVPGAGTWVGPSNSPNPDMHFSHSPGNPYQAPRIPTIVSDVDGDPRSGMMATVGADEKSPSASVVAGWDLY